MCINVKSRGEEIDLRISEGTCWSVKEVKLANSTPTKANPLRVSTMIALSFSSMGVALVTILSCMRKFFDLISAVSSELAVSTKITANASIGVITCNIKIYQYLKSIA